MPKVYKGNTPLLQIDTETDLTDATKAELHFLKPDNVTEVVKVALVSGSVLEYQALTTDFVDLGFWLCRAYVEFESGVKQYFGIPLEIEIHDRWE